LIRCGGKGEHQCNEQGRFHAFAQQNRHGLQQIKSSRQGRAGERGANLIELFHDEVKGGFRRPALIQRLAVTAEGVFKTGFERTIEVRLNRLKALQVTVHGELVRGREVAAAIGVEALAERFFRNGQILFGRQSWHVLPVIINHAHDPVRQ
jgi:hypothetical protein